MVFWIKPTPIYQASTVCKASPSLPLDKLCPFFWVSSSLPPGYLCPLQHLSLSHSFKSWTPPAPIGETPPHSTSYLSCFIGTGLTLSWIQCPREGVSWLVFFCPENWMQARNLDHSFIQVEALIHANLVPGTRGKERLGCETHLSHLGNGRCSREPGLCTQQGTGFNQKHSDPSLKELCKSQKTHLWAKCGQGLLICKLSSL